MLSAYALCRRGASHAGGRSARSASRHCCDTYPPVRQVSSAVPRTERGTRCGEPAPQSVLGSSQAGRRGVESRAQGPVRAGRTQKHTQHTSYNWKQQQGGPPGRGSRGNGSSGIRHIRRQGQARGGTPRPWGRVHVDRSSRGMGARLGEGGNGERPERAHMEGLTSWGCRLSATPPQPAKLSEPFG